MNKSDTVTISRDLADGLLAYLSQRPYAEVYQGCNALAGAIEAADEAEASAEDQPAEPADHEEQP